MFEVVVWILLLVVLFCCVLYYVVYLDERKPRNWHSTNKDKFTVIGMMTDCSVYPVDLVIISVSLLQRP